jgi:hypothetical protein
MFTKKIICLANSRKINGRCVAGKEYLGHNKFGNWIRPVSARPKGELSSQKISYERGSNPKLLDIVTIPLQKRSPQTYQVENILIESGRKWVKVKELDKNDLIKMLDDVPTLWLNGWHSSHGMNDRIPQKIAEQQIKSSLLLVRPDSFRIHVEQERKGKKARARFKYKGVEYGLVITDPIEDLYKKKSTGGYKISGKVVLCVSLGEPFEGWCYKLVAGVIR